MPIKAFRYFMQPGSYRHVNLFPIPSTKVSSGRCLRNYIRTRFAQMLESVKSRSSPYFASNYALARGQEGERQLKGTLVGR